MFVPNYIFGKTTDITPSFLKKQNIKGLILDVDNTLSIHGGQIPYEGVPAWIHEMRRHHISLILVSNNTKKRVAPFAEKLHLDFISMSCKPLPFGFLSAIDKLNIPRDQIALVGDQLFTDILGGNLQHIITIMIHTPRENENLTLKIKRFFERPFINKYYKQKENNSHDS